MSGAKNAVMGDQDLPQNLPVTKVDDQHLDQEKRTAQYSRTKEYKELEAYLKGRIEFFQKYLPNGDEVRWEVPGTEVGMKWVVATNIINEFKAVLNHYENAREAVEKSAGRENL